MLSTSTRLWYEIIIGVHRESIDQEGKSITLIAEFVEFLDKASTFAYSFSELGP